MSKQNRPLNQFEQQAKNIQTRAYITIKANAIRFAVKAHKQQEREDRIATIKEVITGITVIALGVATFIGYAIAFN